MTAGTTAGTIEKEIAKTANFINKHFNADFQCGQLGVLRRWLASNIEKDKRIKELRTVIKTLNEERFVWYANECYFCSGASERVKLLANKIKDLEAELAKKGVKLKEGKL